jgi:hypothetical protein
MTTPEPAPTAAPARIPASAAPRQRLLRNAGYILFVVLWLFVMTIPCLAFALVARGELSWDRNTHDWDRVWLLQERNQRGLGYQAERVINDQSASGGPICVRNSVRYFLWQGTANGADTDYCECFASDGSSTQTPCP